MNIFKRIIENLFKKKNNNEKLALQEEKVQNNDVYSEYQDNFLESLKSQVTSRKKEIEITERVGDGFGFKKKISF